MLYEAKDNRGGDAHTTGTKKPRDTKPKIAIALGSGAARGWAHIGILKRLKAEGIKPDIIVGTSIGALTGGCEAAGILPHLEEFALSLTRRRVFALLDLNWTKGSLIGGSKLHELLTEQLGDRRIEHLERRFAAVATELDNGHELWLTEGNLVKAMRASYALPGIFPPVEIAGKWLIDGAVVNPIPVSVCRALGARYVIAVNLNADSIGTGTVIQNPRRKTAAKKAEPDDDKGKLTAMRKFLTGSAEGPGISAVMVAAYTISQDRLARSRMAGDPPDAVISPKAPEIGLFDFDKARDSIQAGEAAVERMLDDITGAIEALTA